MRVGLTGGVGSGKSAAAQILRELGAVVIDADALAREVVAPGTRGLAAVVEEFGPYVLTDGGELDRARMASLVFADEAARRRLEAIVHPLVYEQILAAEATTAPGSVVVHDIPLLAENGRAGEFDAVVLIDVPEQLQLTRLVRERGWAEADARARIAAQATREERLAIATQVVDNTGTLEDLRSRLTEVFQGLD